MYSRTELLIGNEAQEKLKNSRVLVIGLGGVGGYIVEALSRAGIGTIGICDFDKVDASNKNRQILALDSTLGLQKVDICSGRIKNINPDCEVIEFDSKLSAQILDNLLFENNEKRWDYVADAIDDVPAKLALIEKCVIEGIPMISSMGTGNKLDPMQFKIADISKTNTCPLAKRVRLELRKAGIDKGVKVLFSTEKPVIEHISTVPSISFVPSIAGLLIGGEIIKDIISK